MYFLKLAFMSAYSICKIPFNNVKNGRFKLILRPILVVLAILVLVLTFLIVLPLACYRGLIYVYLKFKHGEDFIKILDSLCSFFFVSDHFGTVISGIFVATDNVSILEECLRSIVQVMIDNVPELSATAKYDLGYYYLLKKKVTVDDIFSVTRCGDEKTLTKAKLCDYFPSCELNLEKLFQIRLLKDPYKENTYVVLLLLHHGIVDAHSAWGLTYKYIFDRQIVALSQKFPPVPTQQVTLDDLYVNPQAFKGILTDGLPLESGGTYFALFAEENVSSVPKIKVLRRKFRCTFNEMIIAVIMYSLCKHMREHMKERPRIITICYVHHVNPKYYQHFSTGNFPGDHVGNKSYPLVFHVEDLADYQNFSDFVEHIRTKSQGALRSTILQTYYAVKTGVLDFMPMTIYRKVLLRQHNQPCLVFSNVGIVNHQFSIRGVRGVGCFASMTTNSSGLFGGFLSYEEKLQVLLASKLHFVKSRNDLQRILDGAVSLIHKLHEEL